MSSTQQELSGRTRSTTGRRRCLLIAAGLSLALPMALSPTHPLAVYGYLFDLYDSPSTAMASAYSHENLEDFLISTEQVQRYRNDLVGDMMDTYTGRCFVIARRPDGSLRQEAIRTWNGFVPHVLPSFVASYLDRKELPFLGDQVGVWLQGDEVIAMGHYHAFGGPPSPGDVAAQYFSHLPEVVVANGLVPMVYLNGELVAYGGGVDVSEEVFRCLRGVQEGLMMDPEQFEKLSKEPTEGLRSFLGYLQQHRDVDPDTPEAILAEIVCLCEEFKDAHIRAFTKGYDRAAYDDDPERWHVANTVRILDAYARYRLHVWPRGMYDSPAQRFSSN